MKMDALVKKSPERGLWLERVDVPSPKAGEALIKIKKTAICGTDVHIYNWDEWSQKTIKIPMVIGHEFVGEIVEINGNSTFKVGDIVSAEGHVVCGTCKNCKRGMGHLCTHSRGIGVHSTGIFGEYAAIPLTNLWKCKKDIPEDMYAIFDPFGNATHTALSYRLVGEDVLITGAGPIGIMAAGIARFAGARNVVLTNTSDFRLELAKGVVPGVITVNTKTEDIQQVMNRLGIEDGFGVGLEMSGNESALNLLIASMMNGGKISLLGLLPSKAHIDWDKVIFGCLSLKGIYGREMYSTWQQMESMLQGGLDIQSIITHKFDYKDYEKGFELMNSKRCGKILLEWAK